MAQVEYGIGCSVAQLAKISEKLDRKLRSASYLISRTVLSEDGKTFRLRRYPPVNLYPKREGWLSEGEGI